MIHIHRVERGVAALLVESRPERVWYVAFRTGESVQVLRTLAEHGYATEEVPRTRMGELYLAVNFVSSPGDPQEIRQPAGPQTPGPR